jgi:hypothetical protein
MIHYIIGARGSLDLEQEVSIRFAMPKSMPLFQQRPLETPASNA